MGLETWIVVGNGGFHFIDKVGKNDL